MVLAITPSVAAAQAKPVPTSYQRAQMQFLELFGTMPNGAKPNASEAWSVVQQYPSVPTNSELANVAYDATSVAQSAPTGPVPSLDSSSSAASTAKPNPWDDYWITFKWGRGLPELFWISQTMAFNCNTNTGAITHLNSWGAYSVTTVGSFLWHHVGFDNQDGMPKWDYPIQTYYFIQTFGWGYGPISGQYSFDMYITWACHSWSQGGPIATGGYTS